MNDVTELPGLLLFAHGARDPAWARPFEAVAQQCRAARAGAGSPDCRVALAFLEFMSPDLVQAGADLVRSGCQRVVVVPLFLGAGGHVRKDIPVLLERLRTDHPQVRFELQPAIGEAPTVVAAMAQAALDRAAPP